MIHPEVRAGSPHRASACDGKKVANVIPVDHGAIRHREVRFPKLVSNTSTSISDVGGRAVIIVYADKRSPIPNDGRMDFAPPMCALPHSTPDAGGPISRVSGS